MGRPNQIAGRLTFVSDKYDWVLGPYLPAAKRERIVSKLLASDTKRPPFRGLTNVEGLGWVETTPRTRVQRHTDVTAVDRTR